MCFACGKDTTSRLWKERLRVGPFVLDDIYISPFYFVWLEQIKREAEVICRAQGCQHAYEMCHFRIAKLLDKLTVIPQL